MSRPWVGFDVGKAFHWVRVVVDEEDRLLSWRVEATEADVEAALSEIERPCAPGERMVGLDLMISWRTNFIASCCTSIKAS